MWFRRSEETSERIAFPGDTRVLDGWSALLETERIASGILVVAPEHRASGFPVPGEAPTFVDTTTGVTGPAQAPASLQVREARDAGEVIASLSGYAMRGVRAGALVPAADGLAAGLAAAAGRRFPFVAHLCARAPARQAQALRGSHDAYHGLANSGALLMFARNAQEVADYALIARRVAERALVPAVCAHDLYATSHAVREVTLAGADLARTYLGDAADLIPAPSDAQRLLFGDMRRRIPLLLDPARPAGIGGAQDAESFFRAGAAARAYFDGNLGKVVDDAMAEFGTLTGRTYHRVEGYRTDDADVVVVAQGSVVDELVRVVDLLRDRKVKAGLVNIAVLRPFPREELAALLQGRRVVTVLECVQAPFFNAPLTADVRAALDQDGGNGRARNRESRTTLVSGIYGAGAGVPSFAQFISVFDNMTAETPRGAYSLGAGFDVETRRFPHLQTLQQRLEREYPSAARTSLDVPAQPALPRQNDGSMALVSPSAHGALFAGNLFARALAAATGWRVHTYPDGGLDHSMQPAQFTLVFGRNGSRVSRPVMHDAVLVCNEAMIETVAATGGLRRDGTLLAASVREPEALWRGLTKRAADWVRAESLSFHVLDARKLAEDAASHVSFVDQLAVWALLGAYSRVHLGLSSEQSTRLEPLLREELRAALDLAQASIDEVVQVFQRGAEAHTRVNHGEWKDTAHPLGEPETPWTVRESAARDGSVFDASRFWHSVGYLYDRGQPGLALADPYLATGIIPGGSSAFRDMTPTRLRLPSWLAENCTACGNCWTQCPETALPAAARTLAELVNAAIAAAERGGAQFVQLKRLADNLARLASRVVTQGGPRPDASLAAILSEAFARLMDKAGLDGDKLLAARAEFEKMCEAIEGLHVAATEPLFAASQNGAMLALAVNPLACNGCGICVTECADGALEWVEQTPARVAAARRNWEFVMQLPDADDASIASLLSGDDVDTQTRRLLDTDAYHALLGGDGSVPGNGTRTAVHLIASTMESVLRSNHRSHVATLDTLIAQVEDRIQGRVQSGFRVNDFEEFSHRLQRLDRKEITPAALNELMGGGATVDAAHLAELTQLLGELRAQRDRYHAGRARFVMTIDPEDGGFWHGAYPFNPHTQPWAAERAGDAITLAMAVAETLAAERVQEAALCRRATASIQDPQVDHDLSWDALTQSERALTPRVLVLIRPETLNTHRVRDVLAGTLPILMVVVDTAGVVEGDRTASLDALMLSLARERRRVAQGSIGAAGHLMQCVADALAATAPAMLRVYAPEPIGSGVAPERIPELARAAVASGAVPAFSCLGGACHVLTVAEDDRITLADWAALQARFRPHYRVVSKGHRTDRTRRLADYLEMDSAAREGIQPYIDVTDARGRDAIALVSNEMVALCERVAARWSALRPDAKVAPAEPVARAAVESAPAPAAASASNADALHALTENLLRLSGFGGDDAFFKRSLREFVSRNGVRTNGDDE